MIMGEVCFEFWGPDESRIYSEVPMGGSLAVWLGGGSWFQRNLEQYLGVFGWACLGSSGW